MPLPRKQPKCRVSVARGAILPAVGLAAAAASAAAADEAVEEIVVTTRLEAPEARKAFAVTRLGTDEIRDAPALTLDRLLTRVPGVSLFRRASSLVAHPTTQGVSLRGIGPNGAGRALVMLDGVPLNDPFGGWVYWSALDAARIGEIAIRRGGGTGAHGNQALTGSIRLTSRRPQAFELYGQARGGNFGTKDISGGIGGIVGPAALSVSGRYFDSNGFHLPPARQRGPVDVPAATEAASIDARGEVTLGESTTLRGRVGWFSEERVNGLALSANQTDALDLSLGLVVEGGRTGPSVEITAYWRDRDFENSFAAVFDAARTLERQVLDQFDMPAGGAGAIGLVRLPVFSDGLIELGIDARRLDGETNERFRNLGGGFTRLREAGGDQWLLGGWLEYAGALTDTVRISGGVRLDYWKTFDGLLRESDLADGSLLRDDAIFDRKDSLVNGRLGLSWQAAEAVGVRMAGYTSFRLPTINEFFRPFRVGNDITRANPELDAERLYGLEAGVELAPAEGVVLSGTYFRNWLEDGVGNVTIAEGPGVFPPAGFVPEGGSLRQRRNIERIVADGVELDVRIALAESLTLNARYLFVDSRITRAADAPALAGKRLAQSPKHSAALALGWNPPSPWRVRLETRIVGDQFEDDLSSRVLPSFATLNAAVSYALAEETELFLTGENLFDAKVISRIDADGLITRAQLRFVSGGVRVRF